MSVIFQTLKKLQSKPQVAKRTVDKSLKNRRTYSIRKVALSPIVVPTVVLLLFASGAFAVFSVHNLHETEALSPSPQETFPSAEQEPQFLHPVPGKSGDKKNMENASQTDSADSDTKNSLFLPKRHPKHQMDRSSRPTPSSGTIQGKHRGEYIPPAADTEDIAAITQMPVDQRPIAGKGLTGDIDVTSTSIQPVAKSATPDPSGATSKPLSVLNNQKRIEEKRLLHTMEKKAQVARLVKMIKRSMSTTETGATDDLLGQLSLLKGEDDLYVLKLKAYWHIRHHRYQAADLLLKKVLEQDENDLEAGINMAVVEFKTDRYADALKRLSNIEDRHPENPLVSDLRWKLK